NQTTRRVVVRSIQDDLVEENETFRVRLGPLPPTMNATIDDGIGEGLIQNDDSIALSIDNAGKVSEGSPATFTVSLSSASTQTVTVQYATQDGKAKKDPKDLAGSDYISATGTLTFAPGETTQNVVVTTNPDDWAEPDEEFWVRLSRATGDATISKGRAKAVIENDDFARLSIDDVTVDEGRSAAFEVTLSRPSTQKVTVRYATQDGTATGGTDYTKSRGTLTFRPGDFSKTVTVPSLDDTLLESDETFHVRLSAASNAEIADAEAIGTIVDQEFRPTLWNGGVQTFQDTDGDLFRLAFKGPGDATVTFAERTPLGADIDTIAFADATTATSLSSTLVKAGAAGGKTTVRAVSALGQSLGKLNLPRATLSGQVDIGGTLNVLVLGDIADGAHILIGGNAKGALTITADEVGDVDLTFPGILKNATVKSWTGGTIQVARVGTLTVKNGNLGADVEADRIGAVKVTGGHLSGNLHAQNASADRPDLGLALGSVTVTGGNITGAITVDRQGSAGPISAKVRKGAGGQIGDGGDTIQIGGRLASLTAAKGINAAITADRVGTIEAKSGDIGQAITVNNQAGDSGNAL
ncbi:MAG: hypothetical protein FJ279_36125, partial [Planctomycetes bacterium]|nr:hypothetical protein [Planctomycetota bacterium]